MRTSCNTHYFSILINEYFIYFYVHLSNSEMCIHVQSMFQTLCAILVKIGPRGILVIFPILCVDNRKYKSSVRLNEYQSVLKVKLFLSPLRIHLDFRKISKTLTRYFPNPNETSWILTNLVLIEPTWRASINPSHPFTKPILAFD